MAAKIVCVLGPTACGKTALGVLLAKRFRGEVVSADSMQIYKGMTIGTAAPTEAEMDGVPHHMIAVADPAERWSAARYAQEAIPIVDGILARGKLPILVGGTGLWVDAVVRGHGFAPGQAGGTVRAELERRLAAEGIAPLLAELRQVDPQAAQRLHPADEKRIVRARGSVWLSWWRPLPPSSAGRQEVFWWARWLFLSPVFLSPAFLSPPPAARNCPTGAATA